MKIKFNLFFFCWKFDVICFVYLVGFGFIVIIFLIMFINVGLIFKYIEIIINKYKNYKWDFGLFIEYVDRIVKLILIGEIEYDLVIGEVIYEFGLMVGVKYFFFDDYNVENNNLIF